MTFTPASCICMPTAGLHAPHLYCAVFLSSVSEAGMVPALLLTASLSLQEVLPLGHVRKTAGLAAAAK